MTIVPFHDNSIWLDETAINFPRDGLYELKELLVSAGWTVESSGDGNSTYNPSGDVIASGATFQNTRAWFRISNPDGREMTFQTTDTNGRNVRWKYSQSAGFIGGTPDANTTPSATDEVITRGGGTDASPTGATLVGSATSTAIRTRVAGAETVSPYRFWMQSIRTDNTNTYTDFVFGMDFVPARVEDTDPSVIFSRTAAFSNVWATGAGNQIFGYLDGGYTNLYPYPYAQSNLWNDNPFVAGAWDCVPITWVRPSASSDPDGIKGFSSIFLTTRITGLTTSTGRNFLEDGTTGYKYLQQGSLFVPYNGTLSTSSASFTARNIVLHTPQGFDDVSTPVDTTPPTVTNNSPSTIGRYDDISITVSDAAPGVANSFIWVKYRAVDRVFMAYEGDGFTPNFTGNVSDDNGDSTQFTFTFKPTTGWLGDIEFVRIRSLDGDGNFDVEVS